MTQPITSLPPMSGTPYEEGTTSVSLERDDRRSHAGEIVVTVRFGNVFSESVLPMTRQTALALRNQLDAALHEIRDYR